MHDSKDISSIRFFALVTEQCVQNKNGFKQCPPNAFEQISSLCIHFLHLHNFTWCCHQMLGMQLQVWLKVWWSLFQLQCGPSWLWPEVRRSDTPQWSWGRTHEGHAVQENHAVGWRWGPSYSRLWLAPKWGLLQGQGLLHEDRNSPYSSVPLCLQGGWLQQRIFSMVSVSDSSASATSTDHDDQTRLKKL